MPSFSPGRGARVVFILPPSYQILRQRLTDRKTESDEQIERRLQTAKNEIKYINHYQYLLINDTVTDASDNLDHILQASHLYATSERKDALLAHWEE